ncbi:hypothetical protein MTX26_24865 [Bradyrhizobium sp. ISRA443]|uniref:hypothetical protein n=1 Tax=unclassified Bradyrhizobium TaxID=2631580 RepID=UPI002478FB8A|nr:MULTISPECIES: hypothetical protein [unclassified Bradyrhizobium]WGR97613.1 hypothetical protein MTX23_24860 [Bradyrhizobium sp. ISRA436]WGS04503.1 hypothetical protein MTX18_24865 [Bradyrhizobium sp. ISRA437]WGS11384.1 hypothetical protein MTX26_24865 [Bradyrhizobium sp. ISRA443]
MLLKLVLTGRTDVKPQAVIGQNAQRLDVVGGAAGHHRMHAAGVIADHAAERVVIVCRGIRPKGELVLFGGRAQVVENAARLDFGEARNGVD